MKLLFKLSGANKKLAIAELRGLFEIINYKFEIIEKFGRFILLRCRKMDVRKICERSVLLKGCWELMYKVKKLENVNWSWVKPPFCARLEAIRPIAFSEAELGSLIWRAIKKPSVNLESPRTLVYTIWTGKWFYVCRQIWRAPKGRFKGRGPTDRPAFHPAALKPDLARLLVNLSRARPGKVLLDPFCGIGAILIEGALLGCKVIGSDIDGRMVKGAKENLDYFCLKGKVFRANVLELDKVLRAHSIDAIATDPPYGRCSRIGARSLRSLYAGFFKVAHRLLKKGCCICLMYPHYMRLPRLAGWQIVDRGEIYVHRGLTRKILILRKV